MLKIRRAFFRCYSVHLPSGIAALIAGSFSFEKLRMVLSSLNKSSSGTGTCRIILWSEDKNATLTSEFLFSSMYTNKSFSRLKVICSTVFTTSMRFARAYSSALMRPLIGLYSEGNRLWSAHAWQWFKNVSEYSELSGAMRQVLSSLRYSNSHSFGLRRWVYKHVQWPTKNAKWRWSWTSSVSIKDLNRRRVSSTYAR